MAKSPPQYLKEDLSGFVGDLRSLLFPSQREAADYFHVSRPTITRYESGIHSPPLGYVAYLVRLLVDRQEETDAIVYREILLKEVNRAILDYYPYDPLFRDWQDLCAVADEYLAERQNSPLHEATTIAPTADRSGTLRYLGSTFFIEALKDWAINFFRWSETSEYIRSSWTGIVLYVMSVLVNRITPGGFLIACVSLLLGIVTAQLMIPALQWPLDDAQTRWIAYVQYGLATLLIPLLVASVTPPDSPGVFQLETIKQRLTFWILKLTGALVGFWVFSTLVIALALGCYYLWFPPLPIGIRLVLALIPLFFSYVAARRIPFDRHKMFNNSLRPHPADRLFLAVFTIAGPGMALFLYSFYWFLSDRTLAPILLVALFTVIAFWEYRKHRPQSIQIPS